ncbi:MAG TPA: TrmH family RNA methyltransferase [Candidatus Saccharimonadales bacterium]|jgi:tRNA G18 (ribose-2'-O)-methylase SpoU
MAGSHHQNNPTSRKIILIAHNLRSCHNVGSLLRTAEGLGVNEVILSGYTPYPLRDENNDDRLPHIAHKIDKQIRKTALGAETMVAWRHEVNIQSIIDELRGDGWQLVAVEQAADAVDLPAFMPMGKVALVVGREVEGIEADILTAMDNIVEIPMSGRKESFNVVQAAAMALYHCRFTRL